MKFDLMNTKNVEVEDPTELLGGNETKLNEYCQHCGASLNLEMRSMHSTTKDLLCMDILCPGCNRRGTVPYVVSNGYYGDNTVAVQGPPCPECNSKSSFVGYIDLTGEKYVGSLTLTVECLRCGYSESGEKQIIENE